jgi:iron complex outermembrane receptor protein/vitamin B12 transporter
MQVTLSIAARRLRSRSILVTLLALAAGTSATPPPLRAQQEKSVSGHVYDPLGSLVPNASVDLLRDGRIVAHTLAGADGSYHLALPASGRYTLCVSAPTFQAVSTPATFLSGEAALNVTLATPTLTQQVTVTATGIPVPEAQTGASVTVLPSEDFRFAVEIEDPLRLVPGAQVTQLGQLGGSTGLSIRGASTDASKVLIDGVPANSIGGAVEFANIANTAFDSVEVLREPNSALYGSDALAGVVSLQSAQGHTSLPLFTYSGDAGNFGTYRNEATAGTVVRKFDIFSSFARMDTRNDIPNSEFHNATYAGNFGWKPTAANELRFTVRHLDQSEGQPNSIALYGIPDDGQEKEHDNYYGAVWNNQATARWHNQIRYGGLRQNGQFTEFGASGIYDPNSGYYDGSVVTLTGANGYSVTGQALFQYSNAFSQSLSTTRRDFVYAQTDYRLTPHLLALGAFKYEAESGSSASTGYATSAIQRGNYSYTLQLSGDLKNRLFYNLGAGLENNGLFGFAATPRASLAYYLVKPSDAGLFNGTKLHASFGKGIKEPSVYQQTYSLYDTLASLPGGGLDAQYHVRPLGAENSRTYDAGLDQQIFKARARLGLTYFHDEFTNAVEYVPPSGLIELGVPAASLLASQYIGAYLNSFAFRTQGVEFESEYKVGSHLFTRAGYTYTGAVVQRSFSSDNLAPSFNTASNFPTTPIGAYSPLVGARPFRVAPHSGYFGLNYSRSRLYLALTGTLVGRRDDSDFLTDSNFGNSLLLPNRNLDGSYQRVDLGGGYQLTPRVNVYANIQNLLSEHYFEAFGYPSLPLTFRSGIKVNFGGESWKLN